jgi:hypothetical protein
LRVVNNVSELDGGTTIDVFVLFGWHDTPDLVQRPLAQARYVVLASPEYWRAHGRVEHPRDLARHACFAFRNPRGVLLDLWEFERGKERESIKARGWLASSHRNLLVDAALAGEGVIRGSTSSAMPLLKCGRLEPVLDGLERLAPTADQHRVSLEARAARRASAPFSISSRTASAASRRAQRGARRRRRSGPLVRAALQPRIELAAMSCLCAAVAARRGLRLGAPPDRPAMPRPSRRDPRGFQPSEWRARSRKHLYMDLPSGRVVIELAPPSRRGQRRNIKTPVCGRSTSTASRSIACRTTSSRNGAIPTRRRTSAARRRRWRRSSRDRRWRPRLRRASRPRRLCAGDRFSRTAFPAARDTAPGARGSRTCYGTLGVGARQRRGFRATEPELYAVIGNAPRILDRNITVAGRGDPRDRAALPRCRAAAGNIGLLREAGAAHADPAGAHGGRPSRERARRARDPAHRQPHRSAPSSRAAASARDAWYKVPAGAVDVCARSPVPVRTGAK